MFSAIGYNQQEIVKDKLICWVDANDKTSYPGTGSNWFDLSRGGYNGLLAGDYNRSNIPPAYGSSSYGAFYFNGDSSYVGFGDVWNFTTESFSLGVWVNFVTLDPCHIFWKGYYPVSGYNIAVNGNQVLLRIYSGSVEYAVRSNTLTTGKWYYVTTTRSGSVGKVYINGLPNMSSQPAIPSTLLVSNVNAQIGMYNVPGGGYKEFYNGYVASFQVYQKELSATEVLQNYNATKQRFGY